MRKGGHDTHAASRSTISPMRSRTAGSSPGFSARPRASASRMGCGTHRNLIAFPQRALGDGAFPMRIETVFLFDLDGTLVDSVYQHVLAWKRGARQRRHRALGVAHPSQDRHERRPVHQPTAARDGIDDQRRARRAAARAARGSLRRHADAMRPLPGARELARISHRRRASRGRSRPAGGWRRRRPISRRSASIPSERRWSRAIR